MASTSHRGALAAFASRVRRAIVLLSLAGLAACGTVVKKPTIEVADVRLADIGREAAQFTVTLRVHNPNPVEISITDIQAKLSLAGTEIGNAEPAQPKYTLASSSTVMLPVRVNIELKSLPQALRQGALALLTGGVPYKISGQVTTLNGLATVPFEKAGELGKAR